MTRLTVVSGDITEQPVDAVVNAADQSLLGGGGVDGAIHRRGGPAILAQCRKIRSEQYPDGLPTGLAVATTAGDLPARWVIHTVGPVFDVAVDRSDELASAYRESMRVADRLGAHTPWPSRPSRPASSAGRWTTPRESPSTPFGIPTPASRKCVSCCSTTPLWPRSADASALHHMMSPLVH